MITQSDDVNTREGIIEWIDEWVKDLKWETKTNFPITMDIFSDKTQKELKSRIGGKIRQDVDKDVERHKTQQNLLKNQGISQEPIILFKTKNGKYELGEGWHRTVQNFKMYPEGYIQPNVYIGLNAKWLNESKQSNPPITRIYFDMDGVLAGFDDQFKKYNKEGYDFKEFIREYGANKAWDIINKGKEDFWAGMGWNPGGKQLYDSVVKLADEKGFEVWILSSPGLDPNGDAKRGKNKWLDKYTNIPQDRRVFKQAKDKHTEAKPGYMLIDDMGKNVSEFINAGGTGIKNNPEDSTEAIKKLYKFKYE